MTFSKGPLLVLIRFANPLCHIFGGQTFSDSTDSTISRLDSITFTWSQVGDLNKGRHGHNVIEIQGEFLVIGGTSGTLKTERCKLVNGQMLCTEQEPNLYNYREYPELVAVSDNYCK